MCNDYWTARTFWLENGIDSNDFVLLLPQGGDDRLNAKLRTAFDAKLGKRRGMVIDEAQAESLLALYSLYAFTGKLIIGSFDLPYGRKLRNLLDSEIATEDELINDVILVAMDEATV